MKPTYPSVPPIDGNVPVLLSWDSKQARTRTAYTHKCPPFSMARVAMTGTAAADPAADGAGAQAPATVVPPGMRSGPWNRSDRVQLEDAVMVARIVGGLSIAS